MAYRLEGSDESHSEKFALFEYPPVDSSVDKVEWIEYRPVSQITADSALEFNISGNTTSYIDLKESRLHIKLRIKTNAGTPVTASDKVALTNLPLHSLWSQVDLALQQQVISSVGTNYPYKAYLDILLNNSELSKKTQLQSQLYFKDVAGSMDEADPTISTNLGLALRYQYTREGQIVDLEGPIYTDISLQKRCLINGLQITLKMWPNKEGFRLMSADKDIGCKIEITDAVFKVCTVKISPGIQLGHAEVLKSNNALYPFERSSIKTYSIPKGYFDIDIDDIFQGDVPTKMVIGLLSSEGYNGAFDKNPFNFQHMNCSFIGFYIDGQSVPSKPLQPIYSSKLYSEAYLRLFASSGMYMSDRGNNITRDDFPNGYCIYMFNINDTEKGENQIPLIKKGHTRLNMKFSKSLEQNTTIVLYASFPGLMRVDEARNVIL